MLGGAVAPGVSCLQEEVAHVIYEERQHAKEAFVRREVKGLHEGGETGHTL